jgi:hypothetical protein
LPSCWQLAALSVTQVPSGSVPPFGTLVQVPSLPATAQLWQVGQAPTPQQKPSVQWPFVHWLSPVQARPFARVGWQLPPGPVQ